MKKVGIVTIFDVPNFGSVLQAHATAKVFEQLKCQPYFINYNRYNNWLISKGGIRQQPYLKRILQKLGLKKLHRKMNNLSAFKKEHFTMTRNYQDLDELKCENWNDFDFFVVGSDQVWNPRFCYGDSFYMLSFVPTKKLKFSIASSFAVDKLPEQYVGKYRKYLSDFDSFSVREKNGIRIIKQQLGIGKEVKLLLDPTLLISREQWMSLASDKQVNEPYILLYMWDYAFNPEPYFSHVVAYFVKKTKYKVVVLEDSGKRIQIGGIDFIDKVDSTIPQFLRLFSDATLVITTSFHGTAFALNFGCPLISIVPENGDDRQSSLLQTLGVSQSVVQIGQQLEKINPFYNVEEEQQKLEAIRNDNIQWIQEKINNIR